MTRADTNADLREALARAEATAEGLELTVTAQRAALEAVEVLVPKCLSDEEKQKRLNDYLS